MIDCDFQLENGYWICLTCSWKYPRKSDKPPRRNCPKKRGQRTEDRGQKKLTPEQKAAAEKQRIEVLEAGKQLGWKAEHAIKYAAALLRWIAAGRPTRTAGEVAEIVVICEQCQHYEAGSGRCKVCGCKVHTPGMIVLSKAALGTERCPKDKWQ